MGDIVDTKDISAVHTLQQLLRSGYASQAIFPGLGVGSTGMGLELMLVEKWIGGEVGSLGRGSRVVSIK
ncbi:hypothetical protein Pmani_034052 [Petrolisthes manimaculis]|uniref:Uncharacterized protein n=1 Tax=Petrolisthes manimaculis TaxID=1843537 RepID=A0AAE1TS32_9EUCA|nr:hypothetical protein Pmani_034052 [Petrolisthes manimaculis]